MTTRPRLARTRRLLAKQLLWPLLTLWSCGGGHDNGSRAPHTPATTAPAESACSDGKDNDGDGFVDCADLDCRIAGGACTLAPPLDRTVASTIIEEARFLYTGDDPLQKDADASAFDVRRLAFVHGKVVDHAGADLAGVRVSVRGHAEHGYTLTRPDGRFDLVVNGGGHLTLHYEKDGFLSADRGIAPRWQHHEQAPDIGLVEKSKASTTVTGNSDRVQTIAGDRVKDAAGAHQSIAVLSTGTSARASTGGEEHTLSSFTVHLTEFPLDRGSDDHSVRPGRFSPGTLPTSGAVTYGFGFTVDEAEALGAKQVAFSRPVALYVEDLLGLPAGAHVPMYYYDEETAQWEPEPAGRVIQMLTTHDGVARVDADGDGNADDDSALQNLGVTNDELTTLAARYKPGTTLWRASVTHFSEHEAVFDVTPPRGAVLPSITGISVRPLDVPSRRGAALVEPRAVGQSIGVAGTPYSLYYQTSRTLEYGPGFTVDVPVTTAAVPPGLRNVHVHIDIQGQTYDQDVAPAPNSSFTYLWNGKDGFGRVVQGQTSAKVTVGYEYDGQSGSDVGAPAPTDSATTAQLPNAVLATTFDVPLGIWDANGYDLGGFGFDVLHAYDPASHTVFFGWGDERHAENVALAVKQPAKDFNLGSPDSVAVLPDGSVIVTDDEQFDEQATGRLLKIDPQGKTTVLAGTGATGAAGDIDLGAPQGVVVTSDGTAIVADYLNDAVRAIHPDGSFETLISDFDSDKPVVKETLDSLDGLALGRREELYLANGDTIYRFEGGKLTVVAGGGTSADDGVPVTEATIVNAGGLVAAPDGSLYFVDRGAEGMDGGHRVRKVSPSGIVHTVAGNGSPGYSGDGGPATAAELNGPRGIALGPDGTLYVADQGNNRIREVTPDGVIFTILGSGDAALGDGKLASNTAIDAPDGVAVGPDGTVYVAEKTKLFALSNGLPSIAATDTIVPSDDGHTLYRFDSRGKHQATIDAVTGVQQLAFAYDGHGHLASITDSDGLVTTVHRDGSGVPDALVAPFQQRTRLDIQNGLLKTVRDDLNRAVTLSYDDQNLLKSIQDPKKGAVAFTYDPSGRLQSVTDPAGYKDTFAQGSNAPSDGIGYSVTATTAQGRATGYTVGQGAANALERNLHLPTGHDVSWSDGLVARTETDPDKTSTSTLLDADPDFGPQTMVPSDITLTTPSGRTLTARPLRTRRLTDLSDPLSVEQWDELVEINGRITESTYTRKDRSLTSTTPVGRITTATLDDHGRTTDVSAPGLAPVHYDYDAQGRVTTITGKVGKESRVETVTYGSDGLPATDTDALKHTVKLTRDAGGRVTTVTLPTGDHIDWSLDDNDNVLTLTPPGSAAHTFAYEPDNLLKLATPPPVKEDSGTSDPSIGVLEYSYDDDRQLARIDHSDGRSVVFDYDATSGRPTRLELASVTQKYGYDRSTDALTSITRSDGVNLDISYDGPLWTGTKWSGGQMQGSIKADYDENLWLASLTVNDASTVKFSYDNDGLLTSAAASGGAITLDRDMTSGMVKGSTAGVVQTAQDFNGFGELANLSATISGTASFSQAIDRDALGRIVHIAETTADEQHDIQYSYDDLGRLVEVDHDGSVTDYAYDANGNRTSVSVEGAEVASGNYDAQDRLQRYGSATYENTAQGDLLRKTDGSNTTELTYDELGNLQKAVVSDGTTTKTLEYFVDGLGRRVAKNDAGRVTQWLYRDALRPESEVNPDGVFTHFVYTSGESAPDLMLRSGVPYRVIKDHLGSVRLVVNAETGAIAQELDYDEFGRVLRDSKPAFQPFGFAGGLYDPDTGLVRFGARDYDAETGRWVAKDPSGFAGGDTDLYAYCGNDPVNFTDATGQEPTKGWYQYVTQFAVDVAAGVVCAALGCGPANAPEPHDKALPAMSEAAKIVASATLGMRPGAIAMREIGGVLAGGAAKALRFREADLVYGPSAKGALRRLQESAGGRLLTDIGGPASGQSWAEFSIETMRNQIASGGRIRFDLTYMEDIPGVLNNTGKFAGSTTAQELRWLKSNWAQVRRFVNFYRQGAEVSAPW